MLFKHTCAAVNTTDLVFALTKSPEPTEVDFITGNCLIIFLQLLKFGEGKHRSDTPCFSTIMNANASIGGRVSTLFVSTFLTTEFAAAQLRKPLKANTPTKKAAIALFVNSLDNVIIVLFMTCTYPYYRYEKKKVILESELSVVDNLNLKEKIKKQFENNLYGIVDVLTVTISHDFFVKRGTVTCHESIRKFTCELIETLKIGNLPNLNPMIDEVYKYKTEENTNFEAFDQFILEKGQFKTSPVDKNKDFLNIAITVEIMWTNALPFAEHKTFNIESAEIQTGLFRREIQ